MKVERKEVFDYLVIFEPIQFYALRAISDKRNESVEETLRAIVQNGLHEFMKNYGIKE